MCPGCGARYPRQNRDSTSCRMQASRSMPHSGVDVLFLQRLIVTLAVAVELAEDQVPKFHIPVAIAAGAAIRFAAAVLLAPVEIDLRAGAAGAGADAPRNCPPGPGVPCGLLPRRSPWSRCHRPRRPRGTPTHTVRSTGIFISWVHELPSPLASLPLEIVAKGEIAQHLKIGAMAGILAHTVDVQRANALLAIGHPGGRRCQLAGKVVLQRRHARVDQQQGVVVLRHQRIALDAQMPFAFKETQKAFPNFVQSQFFHCYHISMVISLNLQRAGPGAAAPWGPAAAAGVRSPFGGGGARCRWAGPFHPAIFPG